MESFGHGGWILGNRKKQTSQNDIPGLVYVATWQLLLGKWTEIALNRERNEMGAGVGQPEYLV